MTPHKYPHAMVDFETLATTPDAVALALGVCAFDPLAHIVGQSHIGPTFYAVLDQEEQKARGRRVDPGTMAWWAQQSEEARRVLVQPGIRVDYALKGLENFFLLNCEGVNKRCLWGNGADFDLVLLGDLARWAGMPTPFRYHNQRCFRTLKNMYPEEFLDDKLTQAKGVERATHHNAVDDAVWQARVAVRLLCKHSVAKVVAEEAQRFCASPCPIDDLNNAVGLYGSL